MRHLVAEAGLSDRVRIESAGTSAWHIGSPPDARAAAEAGRRGIPMTGSGQRFDTRDFARFDYVLAADHENVAALRDRARSPDDEAKIHLLRSFDPSAADDLAVPDPYYGGADGFATVFDLVGRACRGLLDHLIAGPLDER